MKHSPEADLLQRAPDQGGSVLRTSRSLALSLAAALAAAVLVPVSLSSGSALAAGPTTKAKRPTTTTIVRRNVSAVRLAEAKVAQARSGGDQRILADALKDLGYQLLLAKDYGSSVKILTEAASLYRKLKDDSNLAATLQIQGYASIQGGKPQDGVAPLIDAVALRRKLQATPAGTLALVEALQLLALAQRGSGRGQDAIKVLEEVLTFAASGTKGIDTATVSLSIGSIHMDLKNPTAAVKYFERAVAEAATKPAQQVDALQALGWALTAVGRPVEGIAALQRAIKLAGTGIDKNKQGVDLYSLLANAAREAKQADLEIEARARLVAYARAGVAGVTLEDALESLGLTFIFSGRFADALAPLKELVTLSRKQSASSPRLGLALHNLGWALSSAKQYPEAIAALEEAVKIRTQSKDPDLVVSLRFLGYAMWSTKDDRANAVFGQALELLLATPNVAQTDLAQGYLDVSSSRLFSGQYAEAVQPATTALDLYTKARGTEEQIANANYNLGWALFSAKKPAEAIPYLTKARDLRVKNNLPGADDAASLLFAATNQANGT